MKYKILLLVPPYTYLTRPLAQAPLGILYVSSYLKKYAASLIDNITLLDCSDKTVTESILAVADICPDYDIMGITMTTMDYENVKNILVGVHNQNVPIPYVIAGGVHPTVAYNTTVKRKDGYLFDRLFVGDIEGNNYSFANNDIPDRSLLTNNGVSTDGVFCKDNDPDPRAISIITSRGCTNKCAFCVSGHSRKRAIYRSTVSILKELTELSKITTFNQSRIQDDNLFLNPNFDGICMSLGEFRVKWRASARVGSVTRSKLKMAYDGGCRELGLGIESADNAVLDILNKNLDIDHSVETVKLIKDAGIKVRLFFMVNTPGESANTPNINMEYLDRVNPDYITMTIFNPFPGTPVYENPAKYGIIDMSRNFEDYCFNIYADNSRNTRINVKYRDLSESDQMRNRIAMIEYIKQKGWVNWG